MSRGMTLGELLVVVGILAVMLAVGLPAAAELRDAGRAAAAARQLAMTFASERWRAVATSRSCGLLFESGPDGWSWLEVEDGNGNGLRTAEVRSGVDPVRSPRRRIQTIVSGTTLGWPPGGPFPEAPPGTGLLSDGDDPVRFGRSDLVSFSPNGRASSGTLYVTDGRSRLYAVVLFGPGARVRVWRWDRGAGRWML